MAALLQSFWIDGRYSPTFYVQPLLLPTPCNRVAYEPSLQSLQWSFQQQCLLFEDNGFGIAPSQIGKMTSLKYWSHPRHSPPSHQLQDIGAPKPLELYVQHSPLPSLIVSGALSYLGINMLIIHLFCYLDLYLLKLSSSIAEGSLESFMWSCTPLTNKSHCRGLQQIERRQWHKPCIAKKWTLNGRSQLWLTSHCTKSLKQSSIVH